MPRRMMVRNLIANASYCVHWVFLASFPYSFRISGYGHNLELAASCSQEKSIWLNAIHDALSMVSSWRNEPLSSNVWYFFHPPRSESPTTLSSSSGAPSPLIHHRWVQVGMDPVHTAQDLSLVTLLFQWEHRPAAQVQAPTAVAHQEIDRRCGRAFA